MCKTAMSIDMCEQFDNDDFALRMRERVFLCQTVTMKQLCVRHSHSMCLLGANVITPYRHMYLSDIDSQRNSNDYSYQQLKMYANNIFELESIDPVTSSRSTQGRLANAMDSLGE